MKNVVTLGALTLSVAASSVCLAESGATGAAGQSMNQVHVVSHALANDEVSYSAAGRLGYKWNTPAEDVSRGAPSTSGYQWGVMNLVDQAGYRWGNK